MDGRCSYLMAQLDDADGQLFGVFGAAGIPGFLVLLLCMGLLS